MTKDQLIERAVAGGYKLPPPMPRDFFLYMLDRRFWQALGMPTGMIDMARALTSGKPLDQFIDELHERAPIVDLQVTCINAGCPDRLGQPCTMPIEKQEPMHAIKANVENFRDLPVVISKLRAEGFIIRNRTDDNEGHWTEYVFAKTV